MFFQHPNFACFTPFSSFLPSQHSKNSKMRFYIQFLDSAPHFVTIPDTSQVPQSLPMPILMGHCPRIGYRTSFLTFQYANLTKIVKIRQKVRGSQRLDLPIFLQKFNSPPPKMIQILEQEHKNTTQDFSLYMLDSLFCHTVHCNLAIDYDIAIACDNICYL